MPTFIKSRRKTVRSRKSQSAPRRKKFVVPELLPEEIALESAILAAAARDIAAQ